MSAFGSWPALVSCAFSRKFLLPSRSFTLDDLSCDFAPGVSALSVEPGYKRLLGASTVLSMKMKRQVSLQLCLGDAQNDGCLYRTLTFLYVSRCIVISIPSVYITIQMFIIINFT